MKLTKHMLTLAVAASFTSSAFAADIQKVVITPFNGLKTYSCNNEVIPLETLNQKIYNGLSNRLINTGKFTITPAEYDANYIVKGTINEFFSQANTTTNELTGEKQSKIFAKMVLTYNFINSTTKEVVSTNVVTASIDRQGGEAVGCDLLLNEVSHKISEDISKEVTVIIYPTYKHVEKIVEITEPVKVETISKQITTTKTKEVIKMPADEVK